MISIEVALAKKAEREGDLSKLVNELLRAHFQVAATNHVEIASGKRNLTGHGYLAGQPGSVDEFIARKAEEKALEG